MIYSVQNSFVPNLLSLPETGMGYQIIDAQRSGRYSKERFIVYNSSLIVELDGNFDSCKRRIVNEGFSRVLSSATTLELYNISLVTKNSLSRIITMSESTKRSKGR